MADGSLTREELFRKLVLEENESLETKARISLIDKGIKSPSKREIEQEKCHLIYENGKESSNYIKPLSELEYSCLICACSGKNAKQTAEVLDISERSAKKHRNILIQKTGCKNIYEVTHIAKYLLKKNKTSYKKIKKSTFLGVQNYPLSSKKTSSRSHKPEETENAHA